MWIEIGPRFREEAAKYRLAFTCEECANWHAERGACSVLYPDEPHRRALVEKLADGAPVFFCKMFEAT